MYIEVRGVLAATVAVNGTLSVSLPNGYDAGRIAGGLDHRLELNQGNLAAPVAFTVAPSGTSVTITNTSPGAWAQGSPFILQLNQPGDAAKTIAPPKFLDKLVDASIKLINLGSPVAASGTAVLATTAVTVPATNVLPASSVTVPGAASGRALNVVSSNAGDTTQVVTVTGKDAFGNVLSQNFTLNGTTAVVGTKAFATVTSVTASAVLAGNLSVGTINVFGLPVPLPLAGFVLKELTDGAASGTAGTFVTADITAGGPTNTTGDIRGTYAPNTAPNGTHYYHLVLIAPDTGYAGEGQVVGGTP